MITKIIGLITGVTTQKKGVDMTVEEKRRAVDTTTKTIEAANTITTEIKTKKEGNGESAIGMKI